LKGIFTMTIYTSNDTVPPWNFFDGSPAFHELMSWAGQNEDLPDNYLECNWCRNIDTYEGDDYCITAMDVRPRFINRPPSSLNVFELVSHGWAVWMCSSCQEDARHCDDCNSLHHVDEGCWIQDDHVVCDDCRSSHYGFCDDCDQYYSYDNGCSHCDNEGAGSGLISNYSYRPAPIFFISDWLRDNNEPARTSVTGFELEMEAVNCTVHEGAELATDLFGQQCYLKEDGSLSNGFEMVSHPLSREYIDSVFKFDDIKKLADIGMRSAQTRTCGLHVHINRGFFSGRETSFYRFMSMFYSNADQWRTLAGRTSSTYARWSDDEAESMAKYVRGMHNERRHGRSYGDTNEDRYVAINMQPSNTVELRFFKGTLRPLTLKARIEAVHAVAEFSIATRNNINIKASSDWDKFRQFAQTNGYKAFSEYATEKGV
jgi:Putative amidoligase enzyme